MSKARDLADFSSVAPDIGRKNLIINGAMQVAQRGTVTGITSSSYGGADRFELSIASAGTWTMSQSTTAPEGFANSLKLDCTASTASPTILQLLHRFEGQNLQHLKKGTANALPLTLSFWIRSNKTGNIQVNIRDTDNDRMISSVITISSANTFEQKTITIDGDTTGSLDNDNSTSFSVEWFFDGSSTYTSGTTPTAWEARNNADRGVGTTIALADSTDNELYITGVQLEVGTVATPFEHRSYGEELALCQRYYFRTLPTPSGEVNMIGAGVQYDAGTDKRCVIELPVRMRSKPTVNVSNPDEIKYERAGSGLGLLQGLTGARQNPDRTMIYSTSAATDDGTAGQGTMFMFTGVNAYIEAIAEL